MNPLDVFEIVGLLLAGFFLGCQIAPGWTLRRAMKTWRLAEEFSPGSGAVYELCRKLYQARIDMDAAKASAAVRSEIASQMETSYAALHSVVKAYVIDGSEENRPALVDMLLKEKFPGKALLDHIAALERQVQELEQSGRAAWERSKLLLQHKDDWRDRALRAERNLRLAAGEGK